MSNLPPLLPCPFCARPVDHDLIDTLYPSGIYWREQEWGRSYHGTEDRREGDQLCWEMNCTEANGGCGASISADSEQEVRDKWNRRSRSEQGKEQG